MRFHRFSVGLGVATLALSVSTASAQDRGRPQGESGSRPSNGETVGSAAPRGGGDSGGSSSGSSTSSSPSNNNGASSNSGGNNGSSSNSAAPPSAWMDPGSSRSGASRAPVRPDRADRLDGADQRRGNGGQTTGRAVPRGESGGSGSGSTTSTSPNSSSASSGSESQPSQGHSRAVPANSRPRDGRNQIGTAAERTGPPYNGDGHYGGGYPGYSYYPSYVYDPFYSFYYSPYYSRYGYWNPWGYGYGLGYFSYDPYLFGGLADPGYYGGGGYGGQSSSGGGSYVQRYQGAGALRLKIKPSNAQVYIDGYYVGIVESFDGMFQKVNVDGGPHRIELRAEGYETTDFEVVVTPGDTVTYKGDMKRR